MEAYLKKKLNVYIIWHNQQSAYRMGKCSFYWNETDVHHTTAPASSAAGTAF